MHFFLRSFEPLSILASECLRFSRMTLSYPIITLLLVNNEPVYLSNVPNTCFWSNSQLAFVICWNQGCTRTITTTMEISEWEPRWKLIKSGGMRSVMEFYLFISQSAVSFLICSSFPANLWREVLTVGGLNKSAAMFFSHYVCGLCKPGVLCRGSLLLWRDSYRCPAGKGRAASAAFSTEKSDGQAPGAGSRQRTECVDYSEGESEGCCLIGDGWKSIYMPTS